MSLTQLTTTIRSPFNQGIPGLYTVLAAWLAANPSIIIQDVDWFRPESTRAGDDIRVRLAYLQVTAPAVGGTWGARLYRTDGTATAQAKYNLDFAAGADLVPMFTRDVTNHERVINDPDSILVIGIQTIVGSVLGMVGYDRAAFIGQPNADIAAGASGAGTLIDAGGRVVATAATLRNVGAVAWPAQQRNYVVMDEVTGELLGLPSCCTPSAAPAVVSTTTTPYPCPAYLADAPVPVTSP